MSIKFFLKHFYKTILTSNRIYNIKDNINTNKDLQQ